jgi:hypothetical protein
MRLNDTKLIFRKSEIELDSDQIDSSSHPKQAKPVLKKTKCSDEFGGDPDYENSLKLKIIPHGNCDYCEVSIQKVYECKYCKKKKCEPCIKSIYHQRLSEILV